MKSPKCSPRKLLHENPFSKVYHSRADFGDIQKDYYITHFGPRSGVVALRDDTLLMVHQYRFLPDKVSLEIPGGRVENGEDAAQASIRECLEETGVLCRNLERLAVYYPGLDNVENKTTLFYTRDAEETAPFVPDQSETIKIEWVPVEQCVDMILRGEIMDAFTIIGVMTYLALQRKLDAAAQSENTSVSG